MSLLIDSNVLLRLAQPEHDQHEIAKHAIEHLTAEHGELRVVPQVIYEYWVVATRPASNNGLGLSTEVVKNDVADILAMFSPLRDERGIFTHWQQLVSDFDVKGKNAHDARLVAAMQRHGLTRILTFNRGDFSRYPGITVLTPQEAVS